MGTSQKLE